ncbi:hypothetical protein JMF89_03475 [Clostridiaceae bacterium UIB06]|nr:hypothetical protein [Clostridiaceae bacterium UIB06]
MSSYRKGCRHCMYRYFDCCNYCNILGLGPNSQIIFLIFLLKCRRRL